MSAPASSRMSSMLCAAWIRLATCCRLRENINRAPRSPGAERASAPRVAADAPSGGVRTGTSAFIAVAVFAYSSEEEFHLRSGQFDDVVVREGGRVETQRLAVDHREGRALDVRDVVALRT